MSIRFLAGIAAVALCSFGAHAQQASDRATTQYQTPDGKLTVHSGQPGPRQYATPPAFAQLSGGKAYITAADAEGYDLLANDFIYADGNRDGRISKAEYDRWVRSH
jgi:hypothetical protein